MPDWPDPRRLAGSCLRPDVIAGWVCARGVWSVQGPAGPRTRELLVQPRAASSRYSPCGRLASAFHLSRVRIVSGKASTGLSFRLTGTEW